MIKKKIVISLLMLIILSVGVFGTAFAEFDRDEETRSWVCPYCNEGVWYVSSTTYGSWVFDYQEPCDHGYLRGYDYYYTRDIYKNYKCSECTYTSSVNSGTQIGEVCDGW